MTVTDLEDLLAFEGDAVCVTGGARGIGRAVGERVASLGADVALADVDVDVARETAAEVEDEYGVDAVAIETDVTDYADAEAMVGTVLDRFGSLDVLVNNAGVAEAGPFVDSEPSDWDTWVGVSLFGTLNCTHAALPAMLDQGEGSIVNYASSSHSGNDPGLAVYGAAKAGNVSFTKTLAKEVGGDGVRVNCVSPGTVHTRAAEDFIEKYEERMLESYALDRLGQPEDVANVVALLASDATAWVTGELVHVDGGYYRR